MIPRMRQGVLELNDTPPTRVVHCKRAPYDVYIGRDAHGLTDDGWGNPFIIGRDGTREEVLALYREWAPRQKWLMARLHELKGKILGCWCAPQACHGDVLAELADAS